MIRLELLKTSPLSSTDSSYTSVFNAYYTDNRSETLLTKSELESSGLLSGDTLLSLELYLTELPGRDLTGVRIGIRPVDVTTFPTGVFYPYSSFQEVFSSKTIEKGKLTANSWVVFPFDIPYSWDGNTSIVVTFLRDDTGYSSGGKWNVRIPSDSAVRYRAQRMDDTSSTFDTVDASIRTNHIPAMHINVLDRGPQVKSGYSTVMASSISSSIPVTSAKYAEASIQSSSSASALPLRIKSPTATPVATRGLIGYWSSKSGISDTTWSNMAPDRIGRYNGTIIGGATNSRDGLLLDGVNDGVDIPPIPKTDLPKDDITIEVWVKIISNTSEFTDKQLVTTGFTPSFQFKDNSLGFYGYRNGEALIMYSKMKLQYQVLNHLVYQYNLTERSIHVWVNGQKELMAEGVDVSRFPNVWSAKNISFGKALPPSAPYHYLNAGYSAVRIYNRALYDDEILEHYNYGTALGLTAESYSYIGYGEGISSAESYAVPGINRISTVVTGATTLTSVSSVVLTSKTVKSSRLTYNGVSSINVIPKIVKLASVTLNGVSSVETASKTVKSSDMVSNGVSSVEVAPVTVKSSSSLFNGVSSINVIANTVKPSSMASNGVSSMVALCELTLSASTLMHSVGSIRSIGELLELATSSLTSVSSMIVNGTVSEIFGSITKMNSVATTIVSSSVIIDSSLDIHSVSSMKSTGVSVIKSTTILQSASRGSIRGVIIHNNSSDMKAVSSIESSHLLVKLSKVSASSVSSIVSVPTKIVEGSSNISSVASVRFTPTKVISSSTSLTSVGAIKPIPIKGLSDSAYMKSLGSLSASGIVVIPASFNGISVSNTTVEARARVDVQGRVILMSVSTLTVYTNSSKNSLEEIIGILPDSLHIRAIREPDVSIEVTQDYSVNIRGILK